MSDAERYVAYRAVHQRGDELVVSPEAPSPEQRENVKRVLAFYEVPFREDEDGEVLVPADVAADRNTVWNFTTKANDPDWLASHRPRR